MCIKINIDFISTALGCNFILKIYFISVHVIFVFLTYFRTYFLLIYKMLNYQYY